MRIPTPDEIGTATLWLRSNEGDEAERGACLVVAEYLEKLQHDREVAAVARAAGRTKAQVRKALARLALTSHREARAST